MSGNDMNNSDFNKTVIETQAFVRSKANVIDAVSIHASCLILEVIEHKTPEASWDDLLGRTLHVVRSMFIASKEIYEREMPNG